MGRSSNSSHYQLSASRLISRVHVRAAYNPPSAFHPDGEVVIECLGWNGAKVHCRGQVYEVAKGDTFTSSNPSSEIMLDIHDARVLILWPGGGRKASESVFSGPAWNDDASPRRTTGIAQGHFPSSPPPMALRSPISPTPAPDPTFTTSSTFLASDPADLTTSGPVHIYEDGELGESHPEVLPLAETVQSPPPAVNASQSSALSSTPSDEFSDHNEENDPIILSFGPSGENLLPRMAGLSSDSPSQNTPPQRRRHPLKASSKSPQQRIHSEPTGNVNLSPIKNHVINQLAFSRMKSMPLSTILGNLPSELKAGGSNVVEKGSARQPTDNATELSGSDLQIILDNVSCIGGINRQGKDAAGKALENEFYYVPDMDSNEARKEAVVGQLGGTGLRNARKSHKVRFCRLNGRHCS